MNDHDLLDILDRRARSAAEAVRANATERPRPSFDPGRPPILDAPTPLRSRHGQRRSILAIAAAFALVAAGAAWWASRPDDRSTDKTDVISGQPRPFVASYLPSGFALGGAGETTAEAVAETGFGPLSAFGPSMEDPRLGVVFMPDWKVDPDAGEAEPVELGDGRVGYSFSSQGLARSSLVTPVDGGGILVLSPTLDETDLIPIAVATTRTGNQPEVPAGSLPDGWRFLGEEPDALALFGPYGAMSGVGGGRFTFYQRGQPVETRSESSGTDGSGEFEAPDPVLPEPSGTYGMVTISSLPGDELRLHMVRLGFTSVQEVAVRGHDALLGTIAPPDDIALETGHTITWIERPGEVLRVTGFGMSVEDLTRLVEGLQPAGDAEWTDLLERSALGELNGESGGEIVARGRFDDGTAWLLRARLNDPDDPTTATPELTVTVTADSSSSSGSVATMSSDGPVTPFLSTAVTDTAGRRFLAAFVRNDVTTVGLVLADGTVVGNLLPIDAAGRPALVAELTDPVAELVARAADGTELGRTPIDQSSSTGSTPVPTVAATPTTTG